MNTNTNMTRANKLTVKAIDNGHLQADFYRTHRHIMTILDSETGYQPTDDTMTKTAIREEFRKYVAENAATYGIEYDPADRRAEQNIRKAKYTTEADVIEDAIAMITPDIETFIAKMPNADLIQGYAINIESLTAKTHTAKGTDLVMMGIENGKYISSGNLAWFDIEGVVVMNTTTEDIYQTINLELVSGQLKKFRMTQTQWNTETKQSLMEIGLVTEEAKAEKSAKAEKKIGLGDAEHEGLHMDMTAEEEAKAMAEAEEYLAKTAKKPRKSRSKKSTKTEEAEG